MTERLTVGVAARLSRYLQVLTQARKMGKERISSQEISEYTNINATQIRRDLSAFGRFGKRGVGYRTDALLEEIRQILRTQGQHNIALVGAGRLGSAIASSPIFAEHGITVAAVLDNDPEKIGSRVGDLLISSIDDIGEIARERNIIVGVIAVPADSAQNAADALIGAGRLGEAIASSPIFAEHGINIAAVFDNDPEKIGRSIGSMAIEDSRRLSDAVREKNIIVGVVAVPADHAQQVAQELIDSGVRIIFNYSEALLDVPHDVTVHTSNPAVDLLHALYFHLT